MGKHVKKRKPVPREVTGGPNAMKRLADLTQRIIKVPKSELPTAARRDRRDP
jgi:hypothetical protein